MTILNKEKNKIYMEKMEKMEKLLLKIIKSCIIIGRYFLYEKKRDQK